MAKKSGSIAQAKWQEVNKAQVEKALEKADESGCGCELPIFVFQVPGDSLTGRIRPCYSRTRNDRARCAHIHSYTSDGEKTVIAIRMSCMLWAAVHKGTEQLWGRVVRITYKGREPTKFGHYRKIFAVEVDKGSVTEQFESVPIKPKDYKSRKPRKRRSNKAARNRKDSL